MRPPSWLYLPHLHPPWMPCGGDQREQRSDDGDRTARHGHDGEQALGPRAAAAGGGSSAQLRLDARNAHLRRSLEAHAERVAQKRERAEHGSGGMSAADRLSALRRRIAAKANAQDPGGHGDTAATAPETGNLPLVVSRAGRNELHEQMHLGRECMRIRDAPACGSDSSVDANFVQGGIAVAEGDLNVGLGRPAMSSDAANEASRVAWHDIALVRGRQR